METKDINAYTGCVYFLGAKEVGRVKIGCSAFRRLDIRIKQFQTGSPVRLELLGAYPTVYAVEEYRIHDMFAHLREHGEWFRMTPEIQAFIEKECLREWRTLIAK